MHGCCLGQTDGLGDAIPGVTRIPWSHLAGDLGQDETLDTQVSTLDTASLGLPGGILSPESPVTVADLANYAQTGQGDPSIIGQLSTLFNAAGPAVSTILQQYQLGQISSSAPLAQNPLLRASIVEGGSLSSGISTAFANITSSPMLLVGIGLVAFLVLGRKRG